MVRVKDLSDQKQKPFLTKASSINPFFTNKLNAQALFYLFLPGSYYLANTP